MALMKKGWLEVRPNQPRYIRLLHEDLPVVDAGPIAPDEPTLAEARVVDWVAPAVAEQFEPAADFFVVVHDHSMRGTGLLAGDRVAVHATDGVPAAGTIVVVRTQGAIMVRRLQRMRLLAAEREIATSPLVGYRRRNSPLVMGGMVSGFLHRDDEGREALLWIQGPTHHAVIGSAVVFQPTEAPSEDACGWDIAGIVSGHVYSTEELVLGPGAHDVTTIHAPSGLLRANSINTALALIYANPIGFDLSSPGHSGTSTHDQEGPTGPERPGQPTPEDTDDDTDAPRDADERMAAWMPQQR